ncbi:MAG: CspA family cold shock protein [Candidatus Deianiraeaceae bacterium]|jgi:CspA family cold shock protein
MSQGKVKWFSVSKGFGFIAPDDGSNDVFVHITALQQSGIADLKEGQAISYEIESNRGRESATNLQLID